MYPDDGADGGERFFGVGLDGQYFQQQVRNERAPNLGLDTIRCFRIEVMELIPIAIGIVLVF